MRILKTLLAAAAVALCVVAPARADESDKLTYLTFSKSVQLPGKTLPAGRYRFQLADTQESRRVIKVQSEDGKKQLAMLLTIPNQLGVAYNAHVLESILTAVAPGLGWR